jgi:hypothetical protein
MGTYIARGLDKSKYLVSKIFNIDNGSGTTDDDILLVPDKDIWIESALVLYTEATDTTGAASAVIDIGVTTGGEDVVKDAHPEVAKAIGSTTALTLLKNRIPAGSILNVRHTGVAATEVGQYKVQIRYRLIN